ncbi:hypothetical protein [Zhihengliuella halotolerans]|uniref:MinD-like ATPase involved in chromosome partitioning or flagellar assembly n=1 Tax=Zhihengliuella halotolerans TaxID=370736 RepID=A0A4Q8AFN7_9MICC|nr:hypothetical protein [Zhihengliuella halotolerans]RZU62555.1 MinD-like ATPase involved in chromosome partitioning or flagellar assembly [Zhihengliuella halotolerans]
MNEDQTPRRSPEQRFPGGWTPAAPPRARSQQPAAAPAPEPSEPRHVPRSRPQHDAYDDDLIDLPEALRGRARRHGDPLWLRLLQTLRRAAGSDSFPGDFANALDACQRPVTTGRRIGVVGATGGAGTSTLVAALALLLADVRADHIAAVDTVGRPSGLLPRLPAQAPAGGLAALTGLAGRTGDIGLHELRAHAATLPTNLHRLTLDERDHALTALERQGLYQGLSRTCAVSLVELDAHADVQHLHALIVAVPAAPGAAGAAASLLARVRAARPGLPVLPVVVNAHGCPAADVRLAEAGLDEQLAARGRRRTTPAHNLDYDRHLAAGLAIDLRLVGEERRLQVAALAANALYAASGEPGGHA